MNQLTAPNGQIIKFEPLSYNEQACIKVNLSPEGSNNGEGVWAVVSLDDKEKYVNDTKGEYFIAMLANDAIAFYPNRSWGLHVIARFNGGNRPVCGCDWIDYLQKENRIWSPDVPEVNRY